MTVQETLLTLTLKVCICVFFVHNLCSLISGIDMPINTQRRVSKQRVRAVPVQNQNTHQTAREQYPGGILSANPGFP